MVQAAGMPVFSTKVLSSFSALPSIIPCPQTIKGFLALFMSSAAASMAFISGFGVAT